MSLLLHRPLLVCSSFWLKILLLVIALFFVTGLNDAKRSTKSEDTAER